MNYRLLLLIAVVFGACRTEEVPVQRLEVPTMPASAPVAVASSTPEKVLPPGVVSIADMPGVSIDLRYRTSRNFMGQDLYLEYEGHYLHKDAAVKLEKAAEILSRERPGWKLRIYDALRPREIQKKMWQKVKGTSSSRYVADPREGSGHNYGMSVDATLEDEHGREADMGTAFDDFTPLAQPRNEAMYLRNGKLTREQYDNRQLLRRVMKQAGFGSLLQEWWHFNARGIRTIKSRYPVIDSAF